MDELSAAMGVAQLERLAELRAGRARVTRAYEAALTGRDWLRLPSAGPGESVDWFVYVVGLDLAIDRARVMDDLEAARVATTTLDSPHCTCSHSSSSHSATERATFLSPSASPPRRLPCRFPPATGRRRALRCQRIAGGGGAPVPCVSRRCPIVRAFISAARTALRLLPALPDDVRRIVPPPPNSGLAAANRPDH